MNVKKQISVPKVTMSVLDHKRMVALYQLLIAIDKRGNNADSKETKSESKQKIGSLKKRAYLLMLAGFLIAVLLIHYLCFITICFILNA
jgi:hypothetical protein